MDFRLRSFRYPLAIWRVRRELGKSEWQDPAWHRERQFEALQPLLRHCFEKVPFYRRRFQEAGVAPSGIRSLDDLPKLPILTKDDIRKHLDELLASNAGEFTPEESHTGGTTGTAMKFYVDRPTNIMEFATVWRHWNWAGYRFGTRFCDLRGRIIRGKRPWTYDIRLNALFLSSYRLTRERVQEYRRLLRIFRPTLLRGYPSAIDFFARLVREAGIDDIRPRAVVTSSESLLAHQRQNLEEAFHCPVFDTYGLEERTAAAGECPAGRMHLDMEYGIVETLDSEGRPIRPGQRGEIVATGLHGYAMPFIRYRTNDLAVLDPEPCPCGRGLPLIRSIDGRVEDMIITPDGREVSGAGLSVALKYSLGMRRGQILQETPEEMVVRIERSPDWGQEDEKTLMRGLRDRVGEVIQIKLEFVDSISTTPHGKLKFVVSSVKSTVH